MIEEQKVIEYFVGVDLGQAQDYSAICVLEKSREKTGAMTALLLPILTPAQYTVKHLQRLPLGTPYPKQVRHIKALVEQAPLRDHVTICFDYTGVGRPIFDLFKEAKMRCVVYGVSIHGGLSVTWSGNQVSVPKRDLVSVVAILLQSNRLRILESLTETPTLIKELLNFKVRIDPQTSHDSYSSWREAEHDDLVLATALACWIGEKRRAAGPWGRD